VSRLFGDLSEGETQRWILQARELMAEYHEHRDIISLGAYKKGSNKELDRAIRLRPALNEFLKQSIQEGFKIEESRQLLEQIFANEQVA
jgi:flagellum-specific ATP synthase